MSIEKVRQYFQPLGREQDILEFETSSATVELAAQAAGVIPARIAKTLSFLVDEGCVLIVTAGDAKIDNSKFKAMFRFFTGDGIIQIFCIFTVNRNRNPVS